MYVNYRNTPLTSLGDKLYYNNLPNFNHEQSYGRVCFGQTKWNNPGTLALLGKKPIAEQVDALVGGFWQTIFSTDYNEHYRRYASNHDDLWLANWTRKTRTEPDFITKIPWKEMCSLSQLVMDLLRTEGPVIGPSFVGEVEGAIKSILVEMEQWTKSAHSLVQTENRIVETCVKDKLVEIITECCKEVMAVPAVAPVAQDQLELDRSMLLQEIKRLQRNSGPRYGDYDDYGTW